MKFRQLAFTFAVFASTSLAAQSTEQVVLSEGEDSPIVVLDGREITQQELTALDPSEISEISILKGEQATQRFGEKGANGVILVTSVVNGKEQVLISDSVPAEKAVAKTEGEVKMSIPNDYAGLVILDGKESSIEALRALNPTLIDQMQIHKSQDAMDIYGEKAQNGAIIVTTKQ